MSKKVLKEITKLNKVEEISVCSKENPPANRLREFEIVKNSLSKSEFENLFEELSMPEYGEFTSYLNAWLEDDVNQVAYVAFIDALFASLKDVCFDSEMTKEEKASKMKENFDTFVSEYNNSVITKTEDGKVILNLSKEENNIEKQEKKVNILEEIKKFISGLESQETIEEKVEKSEEEIQPAVEQEEPQTEPTEEPEVVEEVVEDAPVEEPTEEVELVAEEPIEEQPEEEKVEEVVEEPVGAEVIEEPAQEPEVVEEIEEPAEVINEEIVKAQETISSLQEQIQELTKAQQVNEVRIEKAELAKSVEKEFLGLAGTTDEIVEHIYSINKSELPLETKDMILNSLKSLSSKNLELTKAEGIETPEQTVKSEEEILKSKVQKLMSEEGISENKAFAVVKGTMSLEKAKCKSKK